MLRGIKENYEKPHARQKRFKSSRSRWTAVIPYTVIYSNGKMLLQNWRNP
jgi:hypothetical protein